MVGPQSGQCPKGCRGLRFARASNVLPTSTSEMMNSTASKYTSGDTPRARKNPGATVAAASRGTRRRCRPRPACSCRRRGAGTRTTRGCRNDGRATPSRQRSAPAAPTAEVWGLLRQPWAAAATSGSRAGGSTASRGPVRPSRDGPRRRWRSSPASRGPSPLPRRPKLTAAFVNRSRYSAACAASRAASSSSSRPAGSRVSYPGLAHGVDQLNGLDTCRVVPHFGGFEQEVCRGTANARGSPERLLDMDRARRAAHAGDRQRDGLFDGRHDQCSFLEVTVIRPRSMLMPQLKTNVPGSVGVNSTTVVRWAGK